jgi:hypothetical protein
MNEETMDALFEDDPRGEGARRLTTWRWSVMVPEVDERLMRETTVEIRDCWAGLPGGGQTAPEDFSIKVRPGRTVGQAVRALERRVRRHYMTMGAWPRRYYIEQISQDGDRLVLGYGT